jgi:hypothetical protein
MSSRHVSRIALTMSLIACATVAAAQATRYTVYCSGRIEVDSRTQEQMLSARGTPLCQFGSFSSASDAERHALNFGGKGASCRCS